MNINELEKLARAAKENMSISSSSFQWEYRRASNPAAILELISINRELVAALELARDMFAANDISLPHTHEVIYNALARANGEINE